MNSAEELFESLLRIMRKEAPASAPMAGKPENVIDEATFHSIEVDKLFEAMNTSSTMVGRTVLYDSLTRPLIRRETIEAKQEALRELNSDPRIRDRITELVKNVAQDEAAFYKLLFGNFIGFVGTPADKMEFEGYGYEVYKNGTRFMLGLSQASLDLPDPKSSYLRELIGDLRSFCSTRAYSLMKGPAYLVSRRLMARGEKASLTPAIRFRPTLVKPFLIAAAFLCGWILVKYTPIVLDLDFILWPLLSILGLPALFLYIPSVGGFDRDHFIYPLRDGYKASPEVVTALISLGRLDELLCYHRYAESFGSRCVLPKISKGNGYSSVLSAVKNPVLGQGYERYVSNDIRIDEASLTFITGPNSGGKTALCKTIAQVQLLAQAGCYVPAELAEVTVADKVFYQVPAISHLDDEEGRFGTELRRTKEIFLSTSPKSLVLLDELSEGTTYEEKLEISRAILDGFVQIGNATILVTHNHELAEQYRTNKLGQFLQVDFVGDTPTYKLVKGISKVSRADIVARKIGFAREDIERSLKQRGFYRE